MTLALIGLIIFSAAAGDCELCLRNRITRAITRDSAELKRFKVATGYPKGRKDYVIDHNVPISCAQTLAPAIAGIQPTDRTFKQAVQWVQREYLDKLWNYRWQQKTRAKQKDRWERDHCEDLHQDPDFRPGGAT